MYATCAVRATQEAYLASLDLPVYSCAFYCSLSRPSRPLRFGEVTARLKTHWPGGILFFAGEGLTMYKPNFCAECGERIARSRWRFWTSRRFCGGCARRFRRGRILLPLTAGAAVFCLGLAAGRLGRSAPPPLIIERGQVSALPAATTTENGAPPADAETGADAQASPRPEPSYGPGGTASEERPTDPDETVSICGARTQKGTPCKRRVRGTGRCWQHKGMPAMLPPAKLIVQG